MHGNTSWACSVRSNKYRRSYNHIYKTTFFSICLCVFCVFLFVCFFNVQLWNEWDIESRFIISYFLVHKFVYACQKPSVYFIHFQASGCFKHLYRISWIKKNFSKMYKKQTFSSMKVDPICVPSVSIHVY